MTQISTSPFGTLSSGECATLYTLVNANGMKVCISDFGGVITQLWVPDKNGDLTDVVLGFDNVSAYETQSPYFGALIGRFGNRIAEGRFELDGQIFQLPCNDGHNHLHGGHMGFDKVLWQAEAGTEGSDVLLILKRLSPDGEQGYPGNCEVAVTYRLTDTNILYTEFSASTDAPTLVNLTQHSYFNLAGGSDVLAHQLYLNAYYYTPVREGLIPTGEVASVVGTAFDFGQVHAIGESIDQDDPQLVLAGGYDHNFVLNKTREGAFELAAKVIEPESGRCLIVKTTEPAVQFYSGNFLDGSLSGKGQNYLHRSGFCIEPQHYPDAPNHPQFPSVVLRPGEQYRSKMSFEFSCI